MVGELHRDAAAEAVPDDRGRGDAVQRQKIAHAVRVAADAVVRARRVGLAVAQQVGCDHSEVTAQGAQYR